MQVTGMNRQMLASDLSHDCTATKSAASKKEEAHELSIDRGRRQKRHPLIKRVACPGVTVPGTGW
jgi:hypothetical protein